jgi:hypothetical protein
MAGNDLRKLILRELSAVESDELSHYQIVGLWSGGSIAIKRVQDTKVALFVETQESSDSIVFKIGQINGLVSRQDELNIPGSSIYGFTIAPADSLNVYPFLSLAQHVFDQISMDSEGPASLADVEELIENWVEFFSLRRGPSTEKVLGVIGELLTLENLAQDLSFHSSYWAGPAMGDHDFRSNDCSIEVKVSGKKKGALTHQISSLNQLDNKLISGRLFLASYRLQLGANYELGTKDLIDRIKSSRFYKDTEGRYLMNIALSAAGLSGEVVPMKFSTFQIDSAKYFEIKGDFPRLTKADVPKLVVDSSYTIDLSSVQHECDIGPNSFISMETGRVVK